jgi:hypothetical protein
MGYSLRFLIFLMAIGPPTLALGYWRAVEFHERCREQELEVLEVQLWNARLNSPLPVVIY